MGSSPGQACRASSSVITTTLGASAVSLSASNRPREPHAKEPQVIRRHDPMTGDRHIVRIDDRLPSTVKRIERRTLQGDVGRDACVGDAGNLAHRGGQPLQVAPGADDP